VNATFHRLVAEEPPHEPALSARSGGPEVQTGGLGAPAFQMFG
jgi:hypothetical protein